MGFQLSGTINIAAGVNLTLYAGGGGCCSGSFDLRPGSVIQGQGTLRLSNTPLNPTLTTVIHDGAVVSVPLIHVLPASTLSTRDGPLYGTGVCRQSVLPAGITLLLESDASIWAGSYVSGGCSLTIDPGAH